ncbi:hypothetical protein M406DRAFT_258748 [Cryphonectria parasitica EP155]|uniref:Mediator of RNA polymerase II transcription subunit 16 n=1 Tax=Cryphonectria parasitica (strain ATCC 38755 / EP155) TaxID=660469 RepID=A0A9P4Y259_CRYP1|nr:uncharacterized protein M406DRAFT_258748 [Cryphonectria parasitica EP155]KAF3764967.1 hypothetical protein M406DRAFT_258748 [Cryphonectria parasitica EP155]
MDDDLFGDEVLPIPPRPPSKQLQQRLDEMRSRGCCRTIAYSKHGIIASISPDGTHVNLQCPHARPDDGQWELNEPIQCSILPAPLPGGPIVHLAWAPTMAPELAVIDAFGRICLLGFPVHLNKAAFSRKWDADAQDDLHSVVGCYWLPLHLPRGVNIICGPVVKDDANAKYQFNNTYNQTIGPWHPNPQKSALVCVTASGLLKLFFSQNNNQLQEIHLEMESVASSDDLITHASICSERGKLLIVLATAAKQLKVILAEISWGMPQPQQDKQIPPGSLPLRPSLKIEHVHTTSWLQQGSADSHLDTSMDQISHLEVLPPVLDIRTKVMTPAMILAVRLHLPTARSHYNLEHQSIIDRWTVALDQPQQLHPAFEQRGSRAGASSSPGTIAMLNKGESIVINKIIVSIETSLYGRVICIGFSDGTVQYRDRITMAEIYQEENDRQITIMQQAGLHFTDEKPSLHTSFSSNNCSYAQICENGKVRWSSLQYPAAEISATKADPQHDAVFASFVMAFANSVHQNSNCDDILAIARPFAEKQPRFIIGLLKAVVNTLGVNIDYSEGNPQDQLPRNGYLHFIMSVLNHFGFQGDFRPRSFSGRFIGLGLSLRNIIILITMATNAPNERMREKINPLDDPEVVVVLSSNMKWVIDLMSWITDGLLSLRDDPKFMELLDNPQRFSEMTEYLKAKNNVSLHLLLCSSTRWLLATVVRRFPYLQSISQKAMQVLDPRQPAGSTESPGTGVQSLYQAYARLQHSISTDLIKIEEFEKLLASVSADVRQMYQGTLAHLQQKQQQQQGQQKPGQPNPAEHALKKAQAQCELPILLADQPPASFQGLVKKLFETDLKTIMGSTNRSELFFTDFPLLDVEDNVHRLARRKTDGRYVDIFRRIEQKAPQLVNDAAAANNGGSPAVSKLLQQPGQEVQQNGETSRADQPGFRRCTRCCSVMEELHATRPGFNFVVSLQRKCVCGGSWAALS